MAHTRIVVDVTVSFALIAALRSSFNHERMSSVAVLLETNREHWDPEEIKSEVYLKV